MLETNIGRDFLRIVLESFSKTYKLEKLFNRNIVKMSGKLDGTDDYNDVFKGIGPHCDRKSSKWAFNEVLRVRRSKAAKTFLSSYGSALIF